MNGQLQSRVLWASLSSAGVVVSVAGLPLSYFLDGSILDGSLFVPIIGTFLLGPAQVLRAAALLQRSPCAHWPTVGSIGKASASLVLTALAVALLSLALGSPVSSGSIVGVRSWTFCLIISCAIFLRLAEKRVLEWSIFPREAAHRRIKSRLCGTVFQAAFLALVSLGIAACIDGWTSIADTVLPQFLAGVLALVAGEAQTEAVQNCVILDACNPPRGAELADGLRQPLAAMGPGLDRWVALTLLAQAVAHRQQGTHPGMRAGTGAGVGAFAGAQAAAYSMPPCAAEVFGRSLTTAPGISGMNIYGEASSPIMQAGNAGYAASLGLGGRNGSGGLFAVYLASGLEVIREFTVRVQCLAALPLRRGPDALLPAQIIALNTSVCELLPLMRVSAAGLSGWICLSRDLDEAGVVQREDALQKLLHELCGLLAALQSLWPLLGVHEVSLGVATVARAAQEAARHSLEQLLLSFEGAGLNQVALPPSYARLIKEVSQ